jgi:hypothetical protein
LRDSARKLCGVLDSMHVRLLAPTVASRTALFMQWLIRCAILV